jgi:hypothetical protein
MEFEGSIVVAHQLENNAQVGTGATLGHSILKIKRAKL